MEITVYPFSSNALFAAPLHKKNTINHIPKITKRNIIE